MKLVLALLLAALAAVNAPVSFSQNAATTAVDDEGLVKAKVPGLQKVYARPDADFSRYNKVMLDPIEVAFSKHWKPEPGFRNVTAEEKQRIQKGLESVLRDEFSHELARTGRYQVVTEPADDVLRIRAEIRDLYINAPDLQRPGITRSYTRSVGEMTLVAELRDSTSGALLARVIDHVKDPESAWLELTTRVDNVAAARRAAADWARILRAQLDAAHGSHLKSGISGSTSRIR